MPAGLGRRTFRLPSALGVVALVAALCLGGAGVARAQDAGEAAFDYTFQRDAEGWTVGFADLPVDHDQSTFDLLSGYRALPEGLDGGGIYVQGHNRSDDLCMFLKRQVGGLRPNTRYEVTVSLDLATDVPPGRVGIGGSPGESVFVKAGASAVEPITIEDSNGYLRMNIDKGNQSRGGADMMVLGHVAHPDAAGGTYRIKTLGNEGRAFSAETDAEGQLWLIVGTDSGFEGLSTFYYARITYELAALALPGTGSGLTPQTPGDQRQVWQAGVGVAAVLALTGLAFAASRRRPLH